MGTINARVRLKSDTTAEWNKAGDKGFVPQNGEFIYYKDTNTAKVGDGVTNVKNVPFIGNAHRHFLSKYSLRNDGVYTYYKLASFPIDNDANSCSLTIDGRIGGWNNGNKGYISLIISNRDGIAATGAIYGNIGYDSCDLVVYTSGTSSTNNTAIIYVKTWSWFAFDLTIGCMSGTTDIYDGIGSTATPAGTLAWSLSQNNRFLRIDIGGDVTAVGELYRASNQPVASTGTLTSSNTTGITVSASSSTPTFTGTSHSHTASDSGHTHTYAKATSASFTGTAHSHTASDSGHAHTYSKTTSASFAGAAHSHTVTDKGHGHTYAKTTSASFTGTSHSHTASDSGHTHSVDYGTKGVSINQAASDATTYYYIKTYGSASFSGTAHSHSITDKSHHHSYTKTTGATFTGTKDLKTAGSGTGITATSSQPSFTGSAHNHGVTDNGHSHTAAVSSGNVQINAAASDSTNYYYLQSGGGSSSFTGTAHNHGITDNGHTHTYSKATSVSIGGVGDHSHTYSYRKTEPSYNASTETLTLTVTSPSGSTGSAGGHSHTTSIGYDDATTTNSKTGIGINNATAGGTVSTTVYDPHFGIRNGNQYTAIKNAFLFALSNTGVTVNSAKTGISINNATAGGSVGTPTITIKDPGHTHTYTPAGSVGLSSAAANTTDSATGITATNATTAGGSVTLNSLGSNWGLRQGDKYTEFGAALLNCAIGQTTTSSGKANISVNGATAGGSVDLGYTDTATGGSYANISINGATAGGSITLGYKDTATGSGAASITVGNATADGSISLGYTDTATGSGKASISVGGTTAGGSVSKPSITVNVNDPGHRHTSRG